MSRRAAGDRETKCHERSQVGSTWLSFRLRATLDCRPIAIDLVSTVAKHVGDATFRHEIVTAFGEAFNNVVIHGYRDRADGFLEVEAELHGDQLTLRLLDTGNPADFESMSPPDLDSMPESGMGLFMIHALVDEVVYERGAPNVLSLTKRISTQAALTEAPAGPGASSQPDNEGQTRDELHPHG